VRLWERLRQQFAHAFAVTPPASGFSPEEIVLLEKIARRIINRGMATPAILFLESLGPLSFLGSQIVHGLKPFMDVVIDPADAERLATLLERRESIERLSSLIQEQANISA
jgi:hypothetical protein